MATFKDEVGDDWRLRIEIDMLTDLKSRTGLNLGKGGNGVAEVMFSDPESTAELLWFLCEEQAARRQLDQAAFYKRLRGDAFERACDSLEEAVVDFSHRRHAKAFKARLPAMRAKTEQQAGEILDRQLTTSATSSSGSPALSESTPEG